MTFYFIARDYEYWLSAHQLTQQMVGEYLRNGPDKNDSNNGNEHVGMQKRC